MRRPAVVRRMMALPYVGRHIDGAYRAALGLVDPYTYVMKNRRAREAFTANRPHLSEAGYHVATELTEKGVAAVHYRDLIPPEVWQGLENTVQEWLSFPEHRQALEAAPELAGNLRTKDSYLLTRVGRAGFLDYADTFVRFAVRPELLNIVNTYLGMMSRVIGANAWHTIPMTSNLRRKSQNWHRDPEDRRIVKIFAYFTDVTETTGATEYVPYSRPGEKYGHVFPQIRPGGAYVPGGSLDGIVAPADRMICSFPAGTILFMDTVGLHRGGYATTGDRVLGNWIYSTQATWDYRQFRIVNAPPAEAVSTEERFALLTSS